MRIHLARHSLAVDPGAGLEDSARYLSARGRDRAREVGGTLSRQGVSIDAVLTSPLVRAVQTAELLAGELGYSGEIQALPALAPGYPPRLVLDDLAARGTSLLLVGHEPTLPMLGALLVGAPSFPPLRPCQVAVVDRGRPDWFLNPETLVRENLRIGY